MYLLSLGLYALAWIIGVYTFNCLLARRLMRIRVKPMLLYVSTIAMLGVFGEVSIGSFYNHLFHHPLWLWRVFPVHHGYTSLYAPFLWGIYGLQLYLLHEIMTRHRFTDKVKVAVVFAIETIVLEIILNATFLPLFGQYVFYYLPGDLWHYTSIQTFPFFFAASLLISYSIRRFNIDKLYFTLGNATLCFVLVFLA